MIRKLPNGSYRVRWDYGHVRRYNYLKKLTNLTPNQQEEIQKLIDEYGDPPVIKTRRSICVKHLWHAEKMDKLFKAASDLEAQGKEVPSKLLEVEQVPDCREDYIEELAYSMASVSGFKEQLCARINYNVFLEQISANRAWIKGFEITDDEVREYAKVFCVNQNIVELKGKTFLFTGAVTGFTGSEGYIDCLRNLAKSLKVDGIITTGEWTKTIFLHKKSKVSEILPSVKRLASEVKIFAIRSNRDAPEMLHELKKIGIEFLTGIEDEKNVFAGTRLHRSSTKDQLVRFEESHHGKNVFVYTTYVGLRSQPTGEGGGLRYLVGSGSSGYNTPSSRFWANAYDNQLFNAENRDCIGGHVLRFDEEANVYPTTFRYSPEVEAILYGGKAYKHRSIVSGKLHLILSDFHASSHDRWALASLLDFIKKHKEDIKTFIINGDFFGNMVLCHHNRGKIKDQVHIAKRDMDFLKEVAFARACIERITSELPVTTKLIYKKGNHEENSLDRFLQREINHFMESFLKFEKMLDLEGFGFEVIDSKSAFKIGDISIHHGHEMSRAQARKTFGQKAVRGHSHGVDIGTHGMTLSGMELTNSAHYLPHVYQRWTLGYATITEVEDAVVLPQPILVRKQRYSDFDGIKNINDTVDITLPEKITFSYEIDWTGREDL